MNMTLPIRIDDTPSLPTRNKWTSPPTIHTPDWLCKETKKQANALQRRLATLMQNQDELDAQAEATRNAPLTEVVDCSGFAQRRLTLLTEELKLRQDIAEFYQSYNKDRNTEHKIAVEQHLDAHAEVVRGIMGLGFNEDPQRLITIQQLAHHHPKVRQAKGYADELNISERETTQANINAIAWVKEEIRRNRERMIG